MNEAKETNQKLSLNSKEQTDSHIIFVGRPLKPNPTPNYEVEYLFITNKMMNKGNFV
jgi:hypothetical protein